MYLSAPEPAASTDPTAAAEIEATVALGPTNSFRDPPNTK